MWEEYSIFFLSQGYDLRTLQYFQLHFTLNTVELEFF